jgi:hypothetical protein
LQRDEIAEDFRDGVDVHAMQHLVMKDKQRILTQRR